jgi:hypothetical protein
LPRLRNLGYNVFVRTAAALPADLDQYLADKEAAVPGVIDGNQKSIAWAGRTGAQTPFSIVYIHGYQGSPSDRTIDSQAAVPLVG